MKNWIVVRGLAAMVTLVAGSSAAMAQWSDDPTVNTVVADGAGSQGVPLVQPTLDGGVWILTMDGAAGGIKPTIQRLTASGERVFPGNGIVLGNRTNTASYTNDLKVDAAGNAIAVFDDTAGITAVKVEPDGDLPWTATGVAMPASTGQLGPRVAVCEDGTIVVCWSVTRVLTFQRLNPDGSFATNGSWTLAETGRAQNPSDMASGGNAGDVILLWMRAEGTNAVTSRKGLKIQKFDSTGQPLWTGTNGPGSAIDIYASSATPSQGIQNGYFPPLVSDGSGGAVVAWYDTGATRNAWLQHVNSDGSQRFPQNGLAASSTNGGTEYRLSASVGYDATLDEYVIGYERSNTLQSLYGLGASRISAEGTLLWGDFGAEVLPIASNHKSFVNAAATASGTSVVSWIEYTGLNNPMQIQATGLDAAGAAMWGGGILGVSVNATDKGRLAMTKATGSDMLICAWNEGAAGNTDVLAQNINLDGTLGNNTPTCPADLDSDGVFGNGGTPDGGVDINDLLYFLNGFEAGDVGVDLDNGTGTGTADGGVDINDLLFFLARFEAGC